MVCSLPAAEGGYYVGSRREVEGGGIERGFAPAEGVSVVAKFGGDEGWWRWVKSTGGGFGSEEGLDKCVLEDSGAGEGGLGERDLDGGYRAGETGGHGGWRFGGGVRERRSMVRGAWFGGSADDVPGVFGVVGPNATGIEVKPVGIYHS